MANENEYSKDEEIRDVTAKRPHVVILGAGASLAAFPKGDRNGRKLPLMNNLTEVVGLNSILSKYGIDIQPSTNFETLYSDLYERDRTAEVLRDIDASIEQYFSGFQLPEQATIYDRLVLSLRDKDLIATFNWDPFLYQACYRNRHVASPPHVVYLHGSVAIGYCQEHRKKGSRQASCSVCKKQLTPSRLLYPIKEKNYAGDPFISTEWSTLEHYLKNAFLLTVFGYGAPASDVAAIDLMKGAWGPSSKRELEQTEIIDVKEEDELTANWEPFIHTHHYDITHSFDDSWLAKHPRRSVEAAWKQIMEAKYIDENPAPPNLDLPGLWGWHHKLSNFE